jgi:hypothetical protein
MRRMGRRSRDNLTQIKKKGKQFDAHRSICELQERVSMLEQLLAGLTVTATGYVQTQIPSKERKRPGPKPVHIWSIRSDRDQLVRMLEEYWPEIEPFCIPQPDERGLRGVLRSIVRIRKFHELPAKHLLDHLHDVGKFLESDRFRGDPRQIANAFGGFPQISVWRSLKICQAHRCMDPIGNRAIRAYIRRKHPALYRDLRPDYSLVNFASALKRYRSTDRNVQMYTAATLHRCWNNCVANYANLKSASLMES